jgi:hypothetical protein
MRTRILGTIVVVALASCGKSETPPPTKVEPAPKEAKAPAPVAKPELKPEAAPFQKQILDGLAKAGLKVGEFEQTAARPYKAKACVQGEVDGLEVLLCSFEGEQPAKDAARSLEGFVGSATTGAVRQRGSTALAVADRKKLDLRGQQINRLLQAFSAGS